MRDDMRSGCLHPAPRTATAARRHLVEQPHDADPTSAALTALDRAEREHSEAVRQWQS